MTGLYSEGENPVALFREKLDRILAAGCYAAVVLRINSPGGGVTASDVMWHDLQEFKVRTHLPVVACLMDVGAGGAYYLSTGADHVVAHPTTITGGIGVILNLYNLEDAMAQFNVVGTPIKAGENVDLGTPIKPPSEAARAILQRMADEFHERFRRIVIERHPQLAHAPPDVFDGRVFTAQQALDLGLIESIGYLDQAAETARELGGAPGAPLILLHRPNDGARTPYDVTANVPIQTSFLPLSLPGLERARLPTFLYLWQPDPDDRAAGRAVTACSTRRDQNRLSWSIVGHRGFWPTTKAAADAFHRAARAMHRASAARFRDSSCASRCRICSLSGPARHTAITPPAP